MLSSDSTLGSMVLVRRFRDLAGAAALGAAAVHTLLALARGWPRAPWLEAATADVVLGVFAVLVAVYGLRWFYPGERSVPGALIGRSRATPWVGALMRASGMSVVVALFVGVAMAMLGSWNGSDATVRAYYVVLVVLAGVHAIGARRRS